MKNSGVTLSFARASRSHLLPLSKPFIPSLVLGVDDRDDHAGELSHLMNAKLRSHNGKCYFLFVSLQNQSVVNALFPVQHQIRLPIPPCKLPIEYNPSL
jgi:hypothetical protein